MPEKKQDLKSKKFIADIFGVTTRRVEQIQEEGIIEGQGRPIKYDFIPTVKAYIKYLSDKAHGREKKETDADLETQKLQAETDLKKAKAEIAEMELKELKGELHRAEDVEAINTDSALYLRSMLMALPGRMAVDLANAKTASEASEIVKSEVYNILEAMSSYRYDPEEYKKRVRERQGWNEGQEKDGGE